MLDSAGTLREDGLERTAIFDVTGQYRYQLGRRWRSHGPTVVFIMLNPSRADAICDDPTLRACMQFAQRWEYAALTVVNLFGYRTPYPNELKRVIDPVGPDNDHYVMEAVGRAQRVVLAWGNGGALQRRDRTILNSLKSYQAKLSYLRLNRSGQPCHPLYVKRDTPLSLYPSDTIPAIPTDSENATNYPRPCQIRPQPLSAPSAGSVR